MSSLQPRGERDGALRQVNPVSAYGRRQGGIGARQQDEAARAGDSGEGEAGFHCVSGAESAIDEARARRQAASERQDIRRARRIGESQQSGQGLSPPPPTV